MTLHNNVKINWNNQGMNEWKIYLNQFDNSYSTAHDIVITNGQEKKICLGSLPVSKNDGGFTIQANKSVEWLNLNELKAGIQLQQRKNLKIVLFTVAVHIMMVALAVGLLALGVTIAPGAGCIVGAVLIITVVNGGILLISLQKFDYARVVRLQKYLSKLEQSSHLLKVLKSESKPESKPNTMTQNPLYGI